MAEVLVVLKVFPEGDEVKLDDLVKEISSKLPKEYKIIKTETEPIAFGLKALVLFITLPEQTEGGTEQLEELVNSVQGVSHAEVINITRLGF
ncbi:MAG: elongation factor 1-beta [Sulfolobaceae archaeon]